jgi:hypothetical protein
MPSFLLYPPDAQPPYRAGTIKLGGFKPTVGKGYTRLFLPARFFAKFGRVVSLTQQGFDPPSTTGRPTGVCRFRAA